MAASGFVKSVVRLNQIQTFIPMSEWRMMPPMSLTVSLSCWQLYV